jgi:hypothetical protein
LIASQAEASRTKEWQLQRWAEAMRWHEHWPGTWIDRKGAKVADERKGK